MAKRAYHRRRVNTKAFLTVLGVSAVLASGVFVLYHVQMAKTPAAFLHQAQRAEKEGHLDVAAAYLGQYLQLQPDHPAEWVHYFEILDRQARGPHERYNLYHVLGQALNRQASEETTLRRRAAHLAAELGLWRDARHHLDELMKSGSADAELLRLKARCEVAQGGLRDALDLYNQVVQLTPADLPCWEAYLDVVNALRKQGDAEAEPASIVERMVKANPKSVEARKIAARLYLREGEMKRAQEEIRQARQTLKGQDPELFRLDAEIALRQNNSSEARTHLETGLKQHPEAIPLRLLAVQVEMIEGKRETAQRMLAWFHRNPPARIEQVWEMGRLAIELGDRKLSDDALKKLQGHSRALWATELLRALRCMRDRRWGEARLVLETLRERGLSRPELRTQAEVMLADCYQALGNPDQQVLAARRALQEDRFSVAARLRLASGLVALGELDKAIAEYTALANKVPEARLLLVRLQSIRQLTSTEGEAGWNKVDQTLATLTPAQKAGPRGALLPSEIALMRGQLDVAYDRAREARDRAPREIGGWLMLAEVTRRQGKPDEALAIITEGRKKIGPRVEWDLALIRHWARIGGTEARAKLTRLMQQRDRWKGPDRERFIAALTTALVMTGADWSVQKKLLEELAEEQPDNIAVLRQLCEGYFRQGNATGVQHWAEQITRAEGEGGPAGAYVEALLCLMKAPDDPEKLESARLHLARAAKLQPSWAQVAVLEGEVAERQGRREEAAQKFRRAVELGETHLGVLRRAVRLLYEQRQYREAQAMLERAPQQARQSGELGRMSALLALSGTGEGIDPKEQRKKALEAARLMVKSGKGDYQDLVFLGQVAAQANEYKEAIDTLERARSQSPSRPDAWVALIGVLARTDLPSAKKTLADAEAKLVVDRSVLALASCHEMVGQWKEAGKYYSRALQQAPESPEILSAVAAYLSRIGQTDQAAKLWGKILDPKSKASPALVQATRRSLAVRLALGRTWEGYKKALELIEANLKQGNTIEDRQIKTLVLATHPAQRAQAISLAERLSSQVGEVHPDFQLLMAWLYEKTGNWSKALASYLDVARRERENPRPLAILIAAYLRHKELARAEEHLKELARLAPDDRVTVELRARLLIGQGQTSKAIDLLDQAIREKKLRTEEAAVLLAEAGQDAEAEKLFRKALAGSENPRILLMLAQHLSRQGKVADALTACDRAWRSGQPEMVAVISVMVVTDRRASQAHRREVGKKIDTALGKQPTSATLLMARGILGSLSGRMEEAKKDYMVLLKMQPNNAVALNNLAYILGVRDRDPVGALKLIDRAMLIAGLNAELYDTRALIHLTAGRPEQARKDLEVAIGESNEPLFHFHLAQAYHAEKNDPSARAAYRKATQLGLTATMVPLLEQPAYQRLRKELRLE
jgi:tetratricopeptide (TPR) repeat protein